ncbi:hypothetical protein Pssp01_58000 [Pseudomonas sp. NBRC 100443]|nr:hypothetical protein Pssp01_58000 [Pseudomonas sp. NBRC 100443]
MVRAAGKGLSPLVEWVLRIFRIQARTRMRYAQVDPAGRRGIEPCRVSARTWRPSCRLPARQYGKLPATDSGKNGGVPNRKWGMATVIGSTKTKH